MTSSKLIPSVKALLAKFLPVLSLTSMALKYSACCFEFNWDTLLSFCIAFISFIIDVFLFLIKVCTSLFLEESFSSKFVAPENNESSNDSKNDTI